MTPNDRNDNDGDHLFDDQGPEDLYAAAISDIERATEIICRPGSVNGAEANVAITAIADQLNTRWRADRNDPLLAVCAAIGDALLDYTAERNAETIARLERLHQRLRDEYAQHHRRTIAALGVQCDCAGICRPQRGTVEGDLS